MQRLVERPRSAWWFPQLALLSALTCLIHYFGIISLGCLAAGALLHRASRETATRLLTTLGIGVLALVAWLPVYARQRHVVSVTTWVEPVTLDPLTDFLAAYFAWLPTAFVLLAVVAHGIRRGRWTTEKSLELSTEQAALLGLLALPITLVVFSVVMQPALIDRYALPAVAGLACIGAIAVARLPIQLQLLLLVGALGLYAGALRERAGSAATFDAGVRSRVRAANAIASDPRPVITIDRNMLYSVALSAVNRNAHLSFLTLPTDTIRRALAGRGGTRAAGDLFIVDRDGATAHHQIFGFPALLPLDSLRRVDSFFALGSDPTRPQFPFLYGGRVVCRVQPYLFLVSNSNATRRAPEAPIPECAPRDLAGGAPT